MSSSWDFIGNEWAVELLRQQIAQQSTRHAYLFIGPPGVGRRTLALRFTQALNCSEPPAPGDYCGKCRECKAIAKQQHADLMVSESAGEGATLKVEKSREARHFLTLQPYQARYRVAIFLRFHETSDGASNALLKTLEEAPPYAVLMLTADSTEQLLPTIVSRCEVLRLRPVPTPEVEAFIEERIRRAKAEGRELPGAEAGAKLIATLSGGRPGYAVQLLEDPAALGYRAEKLGDLQTLLASSRARRFAYAEKYQGDREGLRSTITIWLSFWRDVLLRAGGAATQPANVDHAQEVDALAKTLPLAQARRLVSELERAVDRLDANVNPRLLAEVLLMDWPRSGEQH